MKSMLYVIVKHQGIQTFLLFSILIFHFFRDIIIYALSCRTSGLDRVVELLSETIFQPKFLPEEVH
jgi:hypothetical protein